MKIAKYKLRNFPKGSKLSEKFFLDFLTNTFNLGISGEFGPPVLDYRISKEDSKIQRS